ISLKISLEGKYVDICSSSSAGEKLLGPSLTRRNAANSDWHRSTISFAVPRTLGSSDNIRVRIGRRGSQISDSFTRFSYSLWTRSARRRSKSARSSGVETRGGFSSESNKGNRPTTLLKTVAASAHKSHGCECLLRPLKSSGARVRKLPVGVASSENSSSDRQM